MVCANGGGGRGSDRLEGASAMMGMGLVAVGREAAAGGCTPRSSAGHTIAGADGMDCCGHYLGGTLQVWEVGGAGG